jgi:putative membrane protein
MSTSSPRVTEPLLPAAAANARADRTFFIFNGVLSAVALAVIAYLLLVRRGAGGELDLRFMPAVNASLNGLATVLLLGGYVAIRRRARDIHKYLMVAAFAASALFLVGYLAYHYAHGDTKYVGGGPMRAVYFFILISHIVLSLPLVPMVLTTLYFSSRAQFPRHRRIARWTFPVWLYVSVTGVLVFVFLKVSGSA